MRRGGNALGAGSGKVVCEEAGEDGRRQGYAYESDHRQILRDAGRERYERRAGYGAEVGKCSVLLTSSGGVNTSSGGDTSREVSHVYPELL